MHDRLQCFDGAPDIRGGRARGQRQLGGNDEVAATNAAEECFQGKAGAVVVLQIMRQTWSESQRPS
jgi:hypothetical protein